jgi:ubiquinone biosynthesis monooxygenase Coq6
MIQRRSRTRPTPEDRGVGGRQARGHRQVSGRLICFNATSNTASRAALKSFRYSILLQHRRLSTSPLADVEDRDIVIVGGGPAGLALASALGMSPTVFFINARLNPPGSSSSVRQNASITLVEGGDLTKIKNWVPAPGTYSNRVVSLTNASQAFLKGNQTRLNS